MTVIPIEGAGGSGGCGGKGRTDFSWKNTRLVDVLLKMASVDCECYSKGTACSPLLGSEEEVSWIPFAEIV